MAAGISCAHSSHADTARAVSELTSTLPVEEAEFVLLFHGPNHAGPALERALAPHGESRFYGCSTSGEITPDGYQSNSMVALAFDRSAFTCVARKIDNPGEFSFQRARELVLSMQWDLRQQLTVTSQRNCFALLLVDSLTQSEEFVAAALGSELGTIHLVGASSGDNWQLEETPVLFDAQSNSDCAVLLLVHTDMEFRHYNFHNFSPTAQRGVITSATPSRRLVHEINGAPASAEYARLCGISPDAMSPEILASHPAIITVGDRVYPRGFTQIHEDSSLSCACAIDEGVVFRIPTEVDYIEQLQNAFDRVHQDLGDNTLVLGFECAARRQQVTLKGLEQPVRQLFTETRVWGFSCMGEQSNALNMNNSFNCLAFRLPP